MDGSTLFIYHGKEGNPGRPTGAGPEMEHGMFFSKKEERVLWPPVEGPSIYGHLLAHIDPTTGELRDSGQKLPDESRRFERQGIRLAAGAWDGMVGHHVGKAEKSTQANRIVSLLKKIAEKDTEKEKSRLYDILAKDNLMVILDQVSENIVKSIKGPTLELHEFALELACEAPDRGAVKFGIFLLGLIGLAEDREVVMNLGKHEEFTLFCSVALYYLSEDPESDLWALGKSVKGWGRVHVVERLSYTENPLIKEWIVREGFRNEAANEYLAFIAAQTGELHLRLSAPKPDEGLMTAAAEIIEALIKGGPAEDVGDYPEAARCVGSFLDHLATGTYQPKPEYFLAVRAIQAYLGDEGRETGQKGPTGWSGHDRGRSLRRAESILSRPDWEELARRLLGSRDDREFSIGRRMASALKMETWDIHWDRLTQKPLDSERWETVLEGRKAGEIKALVTFAKKNLPLEKIGTGPGDEAGIAPEFEPHRCLAALVECLGPYPNLGWPLVETSLKSPVVADRIRALVVLSEWRKENWSEEVGPALQAALSREPRKAVMAGIIKVIKGEPVVQGS